MQYTTADILGADCSGQEYQASVYLSDRQRSLSNGTFSLRGSPSVVHGAFSCDRLRISSLEGGPSKVEGCFSLTDCDELTSLQGAPEEVGSMYLENCPVASLVGGPRAVDKHCRIHNAPITSFEGMPRIVGEPGAWSIVTFSNCQDLGSMENVRHYAKEIHGALYLRNCRNLRNPLNVFIIKGLRHFGCNTMPEGVVKIINKYLVQGLERKGILYCQLELCESEFDDFAFLCDDDRNRETSHRPVIGA